MDWDVSLDRLNNPYVWSLLAAGGAVAASASPFIWFMAAFYGWHFASLVPKYVRAVRSEDPEAVMDLMDDDTPELPMMALFVAMVVPYAAWMTVGLPLLPAPGGTWQLWQYGAAAVGGILWFIVSTAITLFGVIASVDLLRRATGRETLPWTEPAEPPEEDARSVADVEPETERERDRQVEMR